MIEPEYIKLMRVAFANCTTAEELREELLRTEEFLANNVYRLLLTWTDRPEE